MMTNDFICIRVTKWWGCAAVGDSPESGMSGLSAWAASNMTQCHIKIFTNELTTPHFVSGNALTAPHFVPGNALIAPQFVSNNDLTEPHFVPDNALTVTTFLPDRSQHLIMRS